MEPLLLLLLLLLLLQPFTSVTLDPAHTLCACARFWHL
jgi:hypothetical protein